MGIFKLFSSKLVIFLVVFGIFISCKKDLDNNSPLSYNSVSDNNKTFKKQGNKNEITLSSYWEYSAPKDSFNITETAIQKRLKDTVKVIISCQNGIFREYMQIKGGYLRITEKVMDSVYNGNNNTRTSLIKINNGDTLSIKEDMSANKLYVQNREKRKFRRRTLPVKIIVTNLSKIDFYNGGGPPPRFWCDVACCPTCSAVHDGADIHELDCICCFYCSSVSHCGFGCGIAL